MEKFKKDLEGIIINDVGEFTLPVSVAAGTLLGGPVVGVAVAGIAIAGILVMKGISALSHI